MEVFIFYTLVHKFRGRVRLRNERQQVGITDPADPMNPYRLRTNEQEQRTEPRLGPTYIPRPLPRIQLFIISSLSI